MARTPSTTLISGACGFLGSHLAEQCAREGSRVIAVDNFSTGSKENKVYLEGLKSSIKVIRADVCKPWTWAQKLPSSWLKNLTHVFHFASPASPPLYQKLALETMWVNSLGLSRALEFADRFKARVIFASTSEIYGDPLEHPQRETYRGNVNTVGPRSCYDESKRFGESLLYTHNLKHGTEHGIVRIFNTYGPRMNPRDGRVIINFLVQALEGKKLTIFGDGKQSRSFCYVDDLVRGIMDFAKTKQPGPVNIGNNKEFTILELAEEVRKLFASKNLGLEFKELPIDDPTQRRPDLSLAEKLFSYRTQVSLSEGLARMARWLEQEGL